MCVLFPKELALRYVLEDGKLNVCLRNLVEWRDFDRIRRESDVDDEKPSVIGIRATSVGRHILGTAPMKFTEVKAALCDRNACGELISNVAP